MEVIKQLRRWRDYKLDQRVIGKKRLIYCFSDSMEIILNSMKKSVTISTNENVLVVRYRTTEKQWKTIGNKN